MKKLAVTGGLSSGKTTVLQLFEDLGAYVVSADAIVHKLLSQNPSVIKAIEKRFGDRVFREGKVDRRELGARVFDNPSELDFLEKLLHPLVRAEIQKEYTKAKQINASLFLAEVPLLYESKLESDYDRILVVNTPLPSCLSRFMKQGGTEEGFYKRYNKQLPMEKKIDLADFVLDNTSDLQSLKDQVFDLHQKLINL